MSGVTNNGWYGIASDSTLMQGDLVDGFPYAVNYQEIPEGATSVSVNIEVYNIIILSQSCDLAGDNKIKFVMVCPYWPLEVLSENQAHLQDENRREAIKRGYQHNYVILNKNVLDGFEKDFFLVDFKYAFSTPLSYLRTIAAKTDKRLRLKSPYREYLSQSFAKYVMRVGFDREEEIPNFDDKFRLNRCNDCEHHPDNIEVVRT